MKSLFVIAGSLLVSISSGQQTTKAPFETTNQPVITSYETTILPRVVGTTAPGIRTTLVPAIEQTTLVPVAASTTAAPETTQMPEETTEEPETTTSAPMTTTQAPETTAAPMTTTQAPETTAAPLTTFAPETTAAPRTVFVPEATPAPEDQGQSDASAVEANLDFPAIFQAALPALLPSLPWNSIVSNGGGFWYYNNGVRTFFPLSSWFMNNFRTFSAGFSTAGAGCSCAPAVTTTTTTVASNGNVRPIVSAASSQRGASGQADWSSQRGASGQADWSSQPAASGQADWSSQPAASSQSGSAWFSQSGSSSQDASSQDASSQPAASTAVPTRPIVPTVSARPVLPIM